MVDLFKKVNSLFFEKAKPLTPGFYQYHTPNDTDFPYRLHLRIEKNGEGILILNASTILHLNQTATEFAYHLIHQTPKSEVLESIISRYHINYLEADQDFNSFVKRINTLVSTPDLDPVNYLDFDLEIPFNHEISSPYRLDCALTYNLHEISGGNISPVNRVKRELSTDEWKSVIQKSWDVGIPHVVFTGGEPTMRNDLVELTSFSDELGQVTGLMTDGLRLNEDNYLNELLNAGLDHLLITLDPKVDLAWDAIRKSLIENIYLVVHLTINAENQQNISQIINKLVQMGLKNISLSTNDLQLASFTQEIRNKCAESGLNLVWNLPVPYSQFNPVSMEIQNEKEFVEGAGIGWLYVEPDGDVLLAQGLNTALGNMLTDSWDTIWSKVKNS